MTQDELNEKLFNAVRDNDIDAARKAIEDGAYRHVVNEHGHTPLGIAIYQNNKDMIAILEDPRVKNDEENMIELILKKPIKEVKK